jgi:hypothetical protein
MLHERVIMKRIYVAGPYTLGDVAVNVANAIDTADRLMNIGFMPFVPHMSHFWHYRHPRPYEQWLEWCLDWVEQCDGLLRIPGESKGADREVAHALKHGIPVFTSIESMVLGTI